ncbi:hypothetical protein BBJ28_00002209 [Nothophytophthora sp. Chile5]|nr:hypothetical protein BBJ28_00002209 [Nothophytophthora sp. Chile5]
MGSPNDARWHARLAALLAASGKLTSAVSHYQRALRDLGLAADADTEAQDEQQQQQRCVRLQCQFELAAVLSKLGNRLDAIALYEEVLCTDPECVEALVNLAVQIAITSSSRLEEALTLCMRALALQPQFAAAHFNRNMLLRRLGRQREAVHSYWQHLTRDLGVDVIQADLPTRLSSTILPSEEENNQMPMALSPNCKNPPHGPEKQESGATGVTVVCVKWGSKYGADYVNKLYNSVMRHGGELTQSRLAFLCMTDDAEGIQLHANLHVLPLASGWKGWWNKCQIFSNAVGEKLRALGHSRCLYVDLDTVIVGDLTDLLAWEPPPGVLTLLKTNHMANEQREGGYNSSIMAWCNSYEDEGADERPIGFLHDFLQAHFAAVSNYIYKFDHWLEMALPDVRFLEDAFSGQVVEYRALDEHATAPPANARVVCFPLLPKPHDAEAQWIAQHWV